MNERIRELADYAGLITMEGNGFDRHALTPPEKEFARLVIEECKEIIWECSANNKIDAVDDLLHAIEMILEAKDAQTH
jgi:hypothetical protein